VVAAWVHQIAAGLEHVHAAGVLHRDIKPSNIFRAQRDGPGEPRWVLLDFGVSSVMGDRSAVTQGILLGTPAYMSPEQVRGEPLDARTDIFSLAAVAYRALTGRPTFSGPNHHATLMAVAHDTPRPPSVIVDVPTPVDDVFAVALTKRREDRYGSAATFAADLAAALAGSLRLELQETAQALRRGR
jgi:eukaryotic-like serine/threonine-protein kinase